MPARSLATRDFSVGDWIVRPRHSRIERDGAAIHVTPRAMAVLVFLAEAGGAVVSRNEILDSVWPRMSVTQDALSRCLVELRKALRNGSADSQAIETIPKIGIRLTLPVSLPADGGRGDLRGGDIRHDGDAVGKLAIHPKLRRFSSWHAAVAAGLVGAAGLAGATLWWTSGSDQAGVAATSSAAARDFFVSAGEYSKRTNRLDALKHQEDLYRRATEADPAFASAWARLGNTHTSIHWYGLDRTPARLVLAEQALRHALELAPDLPEAHLYLASYYFKGLRDDAAALAELAIAERSLSRDPELYFLRSIVHRRLGQWELAARDGETSTELDPRDVVHQRQLHITYTFMRDYVGAQRTLERILSLYPDDGTAYVDRVGLALTSAGDPSLAQRYDQTPPASGYSTGLAYTYTTWLAAVFARDYEKALGVLDRATEDEVFNGDLRTSRIPKAALRARTHRLAGNEELAQLEYQSVTQWVSVDAEGDIVAAAAFYALRAEAELALELRQDAFASLQRARDLLPKSKDALSGSATQLAAILGVLIPSGDFDAAIRELDDYLAGPGQWSVEGIAADPRCDPLRGDPRFGELIAKYRRR